MKKTCFIAAVFALLRTGYGQEVCECGTDRPDASAPAGIMTDHIQPSKKWMLSYRMIADLSGKSTFNGKSISDEEIYKSYLNSSQQMRMDMHMLMGMYGVNSRLTLMGMIQYQNAVMSMNMYAETGTHQHVTQEIESHTMQMQSYGIGDSRLIALYQLYKNCDQTIVVSGGIGIPTGAFSNKGIGLMSYQKIQTYAMQPGTGCWDFSPGIVYKSLSKKSAWGLSLGGRYYLNSNKAGYRPGSELNSSFWFIRQAGKSIAISVRSEQLFRNSMTGADARLYSYSDPGSNPMNTGGIIWRTPAGIQIKAGKHLIQLETGPVIYFKVNGIQQKPLLIGNLAWHFSL